mmetsp:Transcript_28078/g.39212  ORF Transcript_28078/g.39212 Transcript_28078/m.39212 type:complete len:498 (+) Transcript_28078:74-1567(+)
MVCFTTIQFLLLAVSHCAAVLGKEAGSVRARGVAPNDLALYSGSSFKCRDGSLEIESSKVNDDYCDCEDGSDEPGTSACSVGKFYCINKGFESKTLPSSRVNDGICDCCDGSDEWKAPAARCEDTCLSEAREKYQDQINKLDVFRRGIEARRKLEEEGAKVIAQKESEKTEARSKMSEAEQSVAELKVKVEQLQAVVDAQSSTASNDDSEKAKAGEEEEEGAAQGGGGGGNDNTAQGGEEEQESFPYPKEYAAPDAAAAEGDEEGEKFPYPKEYAAPPSGGGESGEEGGEEQFPYPKEYAAPPADAGREGEGSAAASEQAAENEQEERNSGEDASQEEDTTTPEMKELAEAKQKLRDAESEVRSLKSKVEATDKYPSNAALVALYEKCFEKTVRQYTYEVCLFKDSYQKEGSSRTRLGNYDSYDEETKKMSFKNGQVCWNGPARSLTVALECGAETVLGNVDEPSKCVYETTLKTPVVCNHDEAKKLEEIVKAIQQG